MKFNRQLPVLSIATRSPQMEAPEPTIPMEFVSKGMTLRQLFSIAWAHRIATLVTVLAIVIPTAAIIKFVLPRIYTATATLMVDSEVNERANMTPAALASYQSTRIQLMQSPKVLMPVIEKLHLTDDPDYIAGYKGDPALLPYHVMQVLNKNLEIEPGALGSDLLNVTALAKNPIKAAEIANTVSEIYSDQEPGPAAERAKRYATQLAELKSKVIAAQEQVTAFRQRTGVAPDLTTQNNDVESTLLNTLEQRYQEAQNQRRAAEVKAGSGQTAGTAFEGSNVAQTLRAKVESLESQLAQVSSTLGEHHPRVVELKSDLAATRESLRAETSTYSTQTNADLSGARELESKLRNAVEDQRLKVLNFRKVQEEGNKSLLELESAQSVYKRALDGYDEIMFTSGGHGTNVKFVSLAVPPLVAAKPDKVKIMLASIVIGLLLGFLGPLVYELLFNRRVRCADDIERSFELPVLIELDALPQQLSAA